MDEGTQESGVSARQMHPQRPDSNGKAIAAFVISLFCWLAAPVTGILAVVFGWLALRDISHGKKASGTGFALAAIIIPLSLYGLWWLIAGILVWVALSVVEDILSSLQLDSVYDLLFQHMEDRAVLLIFSGILFIVCAVVIPITLNRAITHSRPLSKRQELLLAGWPIVASWLLISGLIGDLFLLLTLLFVAVAASILVFVFVDLGASTGNAVVEREYFITPKDWTALRLTILMLSWAVVLASTLILWLAVSELLEWYLALSTGLIIGAFAWLIVPNILNIDIETLQPIGIKRVLLIVSGPALTLVVSGLLWWVLFLLALVGLSVGAIVRVKALANGS